MNQDTAQVLESGLHVDTFNDEPRRFATAILYLSDLGPLHKDDEGKSSWLVIVLCQGLTANDHQDTSPANSDPQTCPLKIFTPVFHMASLLSFTWL